MKKTVDIKCQGAALLSLDEMVEFQGELKSLSKKNYQRLRKEILETGVGFPFRIWRNEGKCFIIGGHQTKRTLTLMRDVDGYDIPRLPVSFIHAGDYKEAKRRVLQDISQYGHVEKQGLYEFMQDAEFEMDEVSNSFDIPDISLDMVNFKKEYFDDPIEVKESPENKEVNGPSQFTVYIHCKDKLEMRDIYEEMQLREFECSCQE